MDNYYFSSWLCLIAVFVSGCAAQDDDMKVHFDVSEPKIYTTTGAENIELTCVLNRGPLFVTQNRLEIIHQNPITKEERTMSQGAILQESASSEFYNIKINSVATNNDEFHAVFTIKTVRDEDDGPFICKATDSTTQVEASSTPVDIVVVREVEEVMLQFDDHDAISARPEDPIEIDSDTYQVKCMAAGSNPPTTDVKLFLDGIPVEVGEVSSELGEGNDYRTYVSTIIGQVDINVRHSGKDLQCVATDTSGKTLTTDLGIKVNTYDPHVMCNDSHAHEGMVDPTLTCVVNHTGIEVVGFAFQIGRTGEIIEDGGINADNVKVTSQEIEEFVTEVTLNLAKAMNWHFEEDYYIIIRSKGGHLTKERVSLIKTERKPEEEDNSDDDGDGDSANALDGRVALITSILIGLLVRLF